MPPPTTRSRYCPKCETYWPATGAVFSACPLCDVALQSNKMVDSDFETEAVALAHVHQVRESRRKHAEFEQYYVEIHIPAGARKVEEAIKAAAKLTPEDLAAQFAMLCEHPAKENS